MTKESINDAVRLRTFAIGATLCGLALGGCMRLPSGDASASNDEPAAYPNGMWRVATDSELARSVLFVSHILILHRDSNGQGLALRAPGWNPDTLPSRSDEEARRIALRVMRQAQADPSSFERLAQTYSEDVVTREHGGSLGPVSATALPAAFLDALEQTPAGHVSNVVETQLGFHILLRRSPPPRDDIAAQRIVIRYVGTVGDQPSPDRDRSQALDLARRVTARAQRGEDFAALVEEFSEGMDRERGGDLGVWSTLEPGADSTVIEALSELPVGAVTSEPIDTRYGFQIAKRSEPGPRTEFAARVVRAGFDARSPQADAEAHQRLEALLSTLDDDAKARAQLPGAEAIRWAEGHGDPRLTSIVEKMQPGQLIGPVVLHRSYALVARVEPTSMYAPLAASYELPRPGFIDLDATIGTSNPAELVAALDRIRPLFATAGLSSSELGAFETTAQKLRADLSAAQTPAALVAAYRANMRALRKNMSEAGYALVMTLLQSWVMQERLHAPRP